MTRSDASPESVRSAVPRGRTTLTLNRFVTIAARNAQWESLQRKEIHTWPRSTLCWLYSDTGCCRPLQEARHVEHTINTTYCVDTPIGWMRATAADKTTPIARPPAHQGKIGRVAFSGLAIFCRMHVGTQQEINRVHPPVCPPLANHESCRESQVEVAY